MSEKPWETAPLPEPNYGCADMLCREGFTYDANTLAWWPGGPSYPPGWYCDGCIDEAGYEMVAQCSGYCEPPRFSELPALSEELERRDAAPEMLDALEAIDAACYLWPGGELLSPVLLVPMRAAIAKARGETT